MRNPPLSFLAAQGVPRPILTFSFASFFAKLQLRQAIKKAILSLLLLAALPLSARATSTIAPGNPYSYGANIGWMNWRPSTADGVEIGEFVCGGYIWGANVGWIHMGDGTPANNIQYSNTSGTDFGVNWIDTDSDGMADAFEYQNFGNLGMDMNSDSDGDGMSDVEEYLEGTNPTLPGDRLRITLYSTNPGGTNSLLTWTTTAARLYQIEVNPDLQPNNWTNDPTFGIITPDVGATTSRTVIAGASSRRFYRVRAIRPLLP